MVMTGSTGLTTVAGFLAAHLGEKPNTLRQRLKEWYREAPAKKGDARRELNVTDCFAPLLCWVVSWWPPQDRQLHLQLQAIALNRQVTMLTVCVMLADRTIPVAWRAIASSTKKEDYLPHWLELFAYLQPAIPSQWQVVVCADRHLYDRFFYETLIARSWHPFFRIHLSATFTTGDRQWQPVKGLVSAIGSTWCDRVTCFKSDPLKCILLARWDADTDEPWAIVTDLERHSAEQVWDSVHLWRQGGCQIAIGDRTSLPQTRISDPQRAERQWLAIAVATLGKIPTNSEPDVISLMSQIGETPPDAIANPAPFQPPLSRCSTIFPVLSP